MGAQQSALQRCDSCNFLILDEDDVVDAAPRCYDSHTYYHEAFTHRPLDTTYANIPSYVDGGITRDFAPGVHLDSILGAPPRVYHYECAKLLTEGIPPPHPVTWRTFEPEPSEDQRRHVWFQEQLITCDELHPELPKGPYDLARIRRSATSSSTVLWDRYRASEHCYVRSSRQIWVAYITFEGRQYVSHLSNKPLAGYKSSYVPARGSTIDTIFIAENYLGIVNILFTNSKITPVVERHDDVFWRSYTMPSRFGFIKGISDGLKLRAIFTVSRDNTRCLGSDMPCPIPFPHKKPLRRFPRDSWSGKPERVKPFPVNDLATSAYSLCYNQELVDVKHHRKGEDVAAVYKYQRSQGPVPLWQHLPLQGTERIETVRYYCNGNQRKGLISVTTSKQREYWLGIPNNMNGELQHRTFVAHLPKVLPSKIFYRNSPGHMSFIAFDEGVHFGEDPPTSVLSGLKPPMPMVGTPNNFYFTSATTNDITQVRPCTKMFLGVKVIVGLMLYYGRGREQAIGNVRLDMLEKPILVQKQHALWLRIEKVNGIYPNVVQVCGRRPELSPSPGIAHFYGDNQPPQRGRHWFRVPLADPLEWWYDNNSCVLRTSNRRTPIIKLVDPQRYTLFSIMNPPIRDPYSPTPSMEWEDLDDVADLEDPYSLLVCVVED